MCVVGGGFGGGRQLQLTTVCPLHVPHPVSLTRYHSVLPPTPLPHPSRQLSRIMEEVEKLLHWLSNVLDNRVFVALTRGLWDLTAKDVLEYTEDLREAGSGGGGGQSGAAGQRVRA